jgi:hypothetical protein
MNDNGFLENVQSMHRSDIYRPQADVYLSFIHTPLEALTS